MAGREFLAEQIRRAAALGHSLELLEATPGRHRVRCSCGYESTNRRSAALALGAGAHHAGKVAGEASRDGVSIPGSVGARL